jgi:hypothetical protein
MHNDQRGAPIPPRGGEHHPKESISVAEWRTLDRASEYRQLLTERHVLECDRSVSAADQREGSEHDDKRGQHDLSCCAIDNGINPS